MHVVIWKSGDNNNVASHNCPKCQTALQKMFASSVRTTAASSVRTKHCRFEFCSTIAFLAGRSRVCCLLIHVDMELTNHGDSIWIQAISVFHQQYPLLSTQIFFSAPRK